MEPFKNLQATEFWGNQQNFQPPYSLFLQANSFLTGYARSSFCLYRTTSIYFALIKTARLQVLLHV